MKKKYKRDYFYIITRDGQIFEIENLNTRMNDCLDLWKKGGLIMFPALGLNINCVDITKILNLEQYLNYVDSVQPKTFIENGSWYEIKNRFTPIRHESWKEELIEKIDAENKKLIETSKLEKIDKKVLEKFKPDFLKNEKDKNI